MESSAIIVLGGVGDGGDELVEWKLRERPDCVCDDKSMKL